MEGELIWGIVCERCHKVKPIVDSCIIDYTGSRIRVCGDCYKKIQSSNYRIKERK